MSETASPPPAILASIGRPNLSSRLLTRVVSHGCWKPGTGEPSCGTCHRGGIRQRKVCLIWSGCTVSWIDSRRPK